MIADFFSLFEFRFLFCSGDDNTSSPRLLPFLLVGGVHPFWAPAAGRRGRVAILCFQDYSDQVSVWQKDSNGRIVSLLVQCDSVKLDLVNI